MDQKHGEDTFLCADLTTTAEGASEMRDMKSSRIKILINPLTSNV